MGNLTVKESGEMVNFISPNVSKITSFKVHFSPRQEGSGDPSPENVREITGWNGVEGYGCGKNLFGGEAFEQAVSPSIVYEDAQYGKYLRTYNVTTGNSIFTMPFKENTQYTFIGKIRRESTSYITGLKIKYTDGSTTHLFADASSEANEIVTVRTVSSNNKTIDGLYYLQRTVGCHIFFNDFGIFEGDVSIDDFKPYQATTTSTDWTEDVGTVYGGYVDLVSGELVQTHYMEYLTKTTENLNAGYNSETKVFFRCPLTYTGDSTKYLINELQCDKLKFLKNSTIWTPYEKYINTITTRYHQTNKVCMNMYKSVFNITDEDSLDDMQDKIDAYLQENPIQVSYKMETPITYQLTPQQLSTLKGQNNFWSNADYVEIEYELTETFDIQKAKRKIILNQPHVESASGDIVTFDTDMKGKLKECKVYFSPVQEGEGDPSPDNVRNITGWNEVNIYKAGQNLIPNDIPTQFYHVYPSGGHFIESGTAFSTFFIPVPKGKICLARTTRALLSYGALCDELPTVGASAFNVVTMTNRNNHVFDNSEGHKYFAITTGRSVEVNSDWDSFLDTEPRLTISDTVQPYTIPTNISIHSIDWTDSTGTVYGGYVDLVSGELVVNRCFLENENWTEYKRNNGFVAYRLSTMPTPKGANKICEPISNMISNFKNFSSNNMTENVIQISGASLYVALAEGIDASEIQLSYELAEPIHYQLTPQQLLTLKGTNNVYSDTNGQTEIKYWKH